MAKVVTGKVRLSYVHVFEKTSFGDGTDGKYSVSVLVPKTDTATINDLKQAINTAAEEGKTKKWGGKMPRNFHNPLRDGDVEHPDDEAYKGMIFFSASGTRRPGVVDADCKAILDPEEVYSGCWGRVSINMYPYSAKGNNGVAAGLNNVQKLEDGDRLGGAVSSPEDDFGGSQDSGVDFNTDDLPF
jgi:hypothetical protein